MHRNVKVLIKIGEVWQQKVKATTYYRKTQLSSSTLTCLMTASKSGGHLGPHVSSVVQSSTTLPFQELSLRISGGTTVSEKDQGGA